MALLPIGGLFPLDGEPHMNRIATFLTDAVAELHQVRWPTRQQALRLSIIVTVFVIATTAVFGGVDFILANVVSLLLPRV
jgi:preprotein translocase SecE subunit